MFKKKLIIKLVYFSTVALATSSLSFAETINAKSASFNDVSSAVKDAVLGDIVIVPAGNTIWSDPLIITKGITIKGAGIGKTVITSKINDPYTGIINYKPENPEFDESFRITGFSFHGSWLSCGVNIENDSRLLITKIRVDHNYFFECKSRGVIINGEIYGLIDNNQFYTCYQAFGVFGSIGSPWNPWEDLPIELGTVNQLFIEDNTIEDAIGQSEHSYIIEGGAGGRYVFRYNTIINHTDFEYFDMHGNQQPVISSLRPGGSRSTIVTEVYENTIISNYQTGQRLMYQRGGTCILFNNTVMGTAPKLSIELTEEDDWRFGFVSNPPAYDTINNSYFWNNKNNDKEIIPSLLNVSDSKYIQEGSQYFNYPKPDYKPFDYPHPMRETDKPGTPSGLHIK